MTRLPLRALLWAAVCWQVGYAVALSVMQYRIWAGHPFTRLLLSLPAEGSHAPVARLLNALSGGRGYFFYYCFGRFWLPAILTLLLAFGMYALFALVRSVRPNSITQGDSEILTLFGLAFLWPLGLVFYVGALLGALLLGIWRAIFGIGQITICWPAFASAALVLIWKDAFVRILADLL